MTFFFVVFWTFAILTSIAWYGALLFYVGFKGGRDIRRMTADLRRRNAEEMDEERD